MIGSRSVFAYGQGWKEEQINKITKRHKETFFWRGMDRIVIILSVVMNLQVSANVKTHQTVHFKYE